MPLEAYDNKELDTRAPLDWIIIRKSLPSSDAANDDAISNGSLDRSRMH